MKVVTLCVSKLIQIAENGLNRFKLLKRSIFQSLHFLSKLENAMFEENSLRQADLVPLALCAMRHLARKGPGRTWAAGIEVKSVEQTSTGWRKQRKLPSVQCSSVEKLLLLHFAKTGGLLRSCAKANWLPHLRRARKFIKSVLNCTQLGPCLLNQIYEILMSHKACFSHFSFHSQFWPLTDVLLFLKCLQVSSLGFVLPRLCMLLVWSLVWYHVFFPSGFLRFAIPFDFLPSTMIYV